MNRRAVIISFAGLLAVVTLLGFRQASFSRASAGGDLLRDGDEAFLFLNVASRGYRVNYFRYLSALVEERLGVVTKPDDEYFSVVVLRITPETVQRYIIKNENFNFYAPFRGSIYANRQGLVWKWSNTHFEAVGEIEAKHFQEAHVRYGSESDGWSEQVGVLNRKIGRSEFPLDFSRGKLSVVVTILPRNSEAFVDLQTSDGGSSRIWQLDERTRHVGLDEYETLYHSGHLQNASQ